MKISSGDNKPFRTIAASVDYGNDFLIANCIFLSIVVPSATALTLAVESYYTWVSTNSILFTGLAIIVDLPFCMSSVQIFILQTTYVLMYFRIAHSALTW